MTTAWSSLSKTQKSHEVKGSRTAGAYGITSTDKDILHLCDNIVVNDLKAEYYYSQNDVARDAFESHLKVLEDSPSNYVSIVNTLRPVMLEAHKTIAALYLWTRDIDRKLALDILSDVRPTWKLTFFTALSSAPTYAKIDGKWNRTLRAMVQKMVEDSDPYFIMKYADKLKPVVSKAHLKETAKTKWLFKRSKARSRRTLKEIDIFKEYFMLAEAVRTGDKPLITHVLMKSSLPYTIALGILGHYSKDRDVMRELLRLMTPWETILGLKKIENTNLNLSDSFVQTTIAKKLVPERLKTMKIDPIELSQAYNHVDNSVFKHALRELIDGQIRAIGESLKGKLGNAKVAVVFDCSGSMEQVAEWSLMLAYAIAKNLPDVSPIAFSNNAYKINVTDNFYNDLSRLKSYPGLWSGTALGQGLMAALSEKPDVIFFISDFEGNIEPWSDIVYRDYKAMHGKFPKLISIKATSSPWTAVGEPTALRTGRWLGIPEEFAFTIRNLWDLPTILEYLLNLLPKLKREGILKATYIG
jgi:hypothetical protein